MDFFTEVTRGDTASVLLFGIRDIFATLLVSLFQCALATGGDQRKLIDTADRHCDIHFDASIVLHNSI